MASTHRAVAAFLDLAETSLSPRGTVSHTQLTKEQIQEQAAAALQDALKISDEAEKAEKIREVGKAEGKLLSGRALPPQDHRPGDGGRARHRGRPARSGVGGRVGGGRGVGGAVAGR